MQLRVAGTVSRLRQTAALAGLPEMFPSSYFSSSNTKKKSPGCRVLFFCPVVNPGNKIGDLALNLNLGYPLLLVHNTPLRYLLSYRSLHCNSVLRANQTYELSDAEFSP